MSIVVFGDVLSAVSVKMVHFQPQNSVGVFAIPRVKSSESEGVGDVHMPATGVQLAESKDLY